MSGDRVCLGLVSLVSVALAAGAPPARAQDESGTQLQMLQQRIDAQEQRLDALRRSLEREEASLREMRRAVSESLLATQRGGQTGDAAATANPAAAQVPPGEPAPQNAQAPTSPQPQAGAQGQAQAGSAEPVGRAPQSPEAIAAVAPIFEQPGVLTPKGRYVLEPSLQYAYSSNSRVALLGYSVIPALLIGLIDVREVKRNIWTAALTGRVGVTNRFELEARVPYVYRSDDAVSREVNAGTANERVFSADGQSLGDIELAARYQLNDGGADKPYFIGSLRLKTRTGTDPFEVTTDCVSRCVDNATGTGLPLELPTGSGFYSLQAGLTWLYPTDPAVLFGNFTYLHNFKRTVSRELRDGTRESLGEIRPGGVFGFNFGMGLAINDKSSFSIGYDHASVGKTLQDGDVVPGSVRTQLATLLVGYSYRLSEKRSIGLSVGAGLTRDTPDTTLTVRMPMTF